MRELTDDQSLDIGSLGFLIFQIRADIADMWIGQADNLTGIAWVGENFLVAGEAGVENDFAAAPRGGSGCASTKNSPVLKRKDC